MKMIAELEHLFSKVDKSSTVSFYETQNKISEDCDCTECAYYEQEFVKKPLQVFTFLKSAGVDLTKNLTSEPTGVWVVREGEKFIYCDQPYQINGDFKDVDSFDIELVEGDLKTEVEVQKKNESTIVFYFKVSLID